MPTGFDEAFRRVKELVATFQANEVVASSLLAAPKHDFQTQMANIDALIAKLQENNAPKVAPAEPSAQKKQTATVKS